MSRIFCRKGNLVGKTKGSHAPVWVTIGRPFKQSPQTARCAQGKRHKNCRDRRPRRSISRNFLQYEPSVTDRRGRRSLQRCTQSPPLQQIKCCFARTGRRGRRPLPRREAFIEQTRRGGVSPPVQQSEALPPNPQIPRPRRRGYIQGGRRLRCFPSSRCAGAPHRTPQ